MKITKRAENLLRDCFTDDGEVFCSAVDTCLGTMPLWGQLVLAGYVFEREPSLMGHPFSYELTESGEAFLKGKPLTSLTLRYAPPQPQKLVARLASQNATLQKGLHEALQHIETCLDIIRTD